MTTLWRNYSIAVLFNVKFNLNKSFELPNNDSKIHKAQVIYLFKIYFCCILTSLRDCQVRSIPLCLQQFRILFQLNLARLHDRGHV